MKSVARKIVIGSLGVILIAVVGLLVVISVLHIRESSEIEQSWRNASHAKLSGLGSTSTLAVLPLVNWHKADERYQTEMGVSYLIRTDSQTILFDVGHNPEQAAPSVLQHNMQESGIAPDDIDIIFLSHNHLDHVGGLKWSRMQTFSLGNRQTDLGDLTVFSPVPMTYPGLTPVHTPDPKVLAEGIATTGTITRRLFIGPIDEQALVINVEGKGLVLIVGCGHQTLPKILEKTKAVFNEPIYGLIGDLHYPVPEGRLSLLGIDVQRRLASGDGPWDPVSEQDVEHNIRMLQELEPGIVALGGHDSSDEVIAQFADAFGDAYRYVRVGDWIKVSGH